MAFVAPLIAGALGVGAIGEAIIGVGLAVAAGFASRALAPKAATSSNGGMRLSLRTEANGPRELVVGRAAVAGTLVYHQVWGPNGNDNLQLGFLLADHECDALETVYVSGVAASWNASTGAVTEYPGMKITFHSGAAGQAADADLMANGGGRWTSTDRGTGLCYVVVQMAYDQRLYTTGLPTFLFVIRGAKLYDIRLDSTAGGSGAQRWGTPGTYAWTDNPVVIAYNYGRGIWQGSQRLIGMAAPASALPAATWIAEANICDEAVTLAGGGTEQRYRANGVISSASTHRQVFNDLTTACGGLFIETAGALKLRTGAARTAVATITDDDLIEGAEIEISPKRPRSELVNAVFGTFADPTQHYESTALPPRLSPADETTDGGIRLEQHYPLDLVTSATQGQRILEIMRRRGRHQLQVQIRLPAAFCAVEAGDWIGWTSTRYGWSGALFEVMVATVEADKTVALALREISTAAYGWTTGDQLDPANPGTLPSGGPTLTAVSGLGVSVVTVTNGTTASRPGIGATWTAITDPTVYSVRFQYRRVGDTTALEVECLTPGAGNYVWISSVQGETAYEVRALPVCRPDRATTWTSWISTTATAQQVVAVANLAAIATSVPANTITPAMLSAQARFELGLSSTVAGIQGSVQQQITDTLEEIRRVAEHAVTARLLQADLATGIRIEQTVRQSGDEALAQEISVVAASLGATQAGIIVETTARVTADSALASQLTTLTATVAGNATAAAASIASEATARASADSALTTQLTTLTSTVNANNTAQTASIASEATARASGDSANASSINTVSTVVGSHTASISTMQTSVDGLSARWTVALTAGYATGFATLSGGTTGSTFGVVADNFYVALPNGFGGYVSGGAPRQVFTAGTINGSPGIGISANVFIDGSIQARSMSVTSLDAICGVFGSLTAGTITSPDGKLYISSQSGAAEIRITA